MQKFRRLCCVIFLAIACSFQPSHAQKLSAVVAFGDSLSDLGNTFNYMGDYPSYWLAGYNSYYYDQGRWSDGPLWVEDLVSLLHFAALQPNLGSDLYGTDFAWGGSTSGDGFTSFSVLGIEYDLPNLQTQIRYYTKLLTTKNARMPKISETLFTIWSGGNDVIYLVQGSPIKVKITPPEMVTHIASAITTLYSQGGRYFLVPNLPPLGEKPNFRTNPQYRMKANAFVNAYNPLLQAELVQLPQKLPGAKIVEFDVASLFQKVLQDPDAYGFKNITDPAFTADIFEPHGGDVVGNPDQYLFWDETHPTVFGHGIVGEAAYDRVQAGFGLLLGGMQPGLSRAP